MKGNKYDYTITVLYVNNYNYNCREIRKKKQYIS